MKKVTINDEEKVASFFTEDLLKGLIEAYVFNFPSHKTHNIPESEFYSDATQN